MAGASILTVGLLAACSTTNNSNANTSTYSYVFTADPATLDYLIAANAGTTEYTANMIDGLLENDRYGNLIPSIAEDWTVSKDGLTYTYKLRKDAKWYTHDGEEYAPVTAHDFVAGIKHAADKQSNGLYIIQNSIKGLDDYISGKTTDFASVGVKALDDYTVQYTLNAPETFWNSKTTQSVLFPVNEDFLKSQGDRFGNPSDAASLLYNGPYILKGITSKSLIEIVKNPNYWDKENVHIDTIKYAFFDAQTQEFDSIMSGFDNGNYTASPLLKDSGNYESIAEKYKDNIIYGSQGSQTSYISFNVNRQNYTHTSKTSDAQKTDAQKALQNKDFRQAISFAFNRHNFAAQTYGEETADNKLRNLFVPPTFVQIGDKNFDSAVKEELVKLGDEWSDVNLADGQDGIFNANKARAELEKSKKTLEADGVTFPIHLDIPVVENLAENVKNVQSIKQKLEENLGKENISIDIQGVSQEEVSNTTLQVSEARLTDWDINPAIGWTPDYDDPSSYLDIFNSQDGALIRQTLGIEPGSNVPAIEKISLNQYDKLVQEANQEQDIAQRYQKYALAQAWLTDNALIIPTMSDGGAPVMTRMTIATAPFSWTGDKGTKSLKYAQLQAKPVTIKEREEARAKWLKEKEESNAEYQKELEKHVEQ